MIIFVYLYLDAIGGWQMKQLKSKSIESLAVFDDIRLEFEQIESIESSALFDGIRFGFEQIEETLSVTEKYYRTIYQNAIDIEDTDEFQRVTAQSQKSIRQITSWRKKLRTIAEEIISSEVYAYENTTTATTSDDEITPVPKLKESVFETESETPSDSDKIEATEEVEIKTTESNSNQSATTSNVKPVSITLFGKTYVVNSWSDIYIKVCEIMLLLEPFTIATLDKDEELNPRGEVNFSYTESEITSERKRLANGLWIKMHNEVQTCANTCRKIIEKCGYQSDSLTIDYKEKELIHG